MNLHTQKNNAHMHKLLLAMVMALVMALVSDQLALEYCPVQRM